MTANPQSITRIALVGICASLVLGIVLGPQAEPEQKPEPKPAPQPLAETRLALADSPLIRATPSVPTFHDSAEVPQGAVTSHFVLSEEDLQTIEDLPAACRSELPGLAATNAAPHLAADQPTYNDNAADEIAVWQANQLDDHQQAISQLVNYESAEPEKLNPHAAATAIGARPVAKTGEDPHLDVFSRTAFPSAAECATCHQQIYDEWAISSHSYAAISPMFHAFENKINQLTSGTIGYFCLRCHAPVATTMGLRRDQAIWDGPKVFREGVTCVACHRVKTPYVKTNGERRIEPGDIYEPVYGSSDGKNVEVAVKYDQYFKTKTSPESKIPGQAMHRRSIEFEELSESTFCMSCHQVAVQPGIKLEVVWDQYRGSPAYREGVSCHDCHMGKVPGVDGGYYVGPAAVVGQRVMEPERKHSNHSFYGPGYSIAHPGVWPMIKDADRWSFNDWLEFDWRAGWGTEKYEEALADSGNKAFFPTMWQEADDRYDAREIIDANLKKLEYKKDIRRQVLENGSKLDGPFFNGPRQVNNSLDFSYCITNVSNGHNMPSGSLGAQPQIWMNVALIDPTGQRIWETGYVDSHGDLADLHSLDVQQRCIEFDKQLFNLQTKFLTTNAKGTDREMMLPITLDGDQLPFIRPAIQAVSTINHPPFIRMEGHSLPALGSRTAKFSVPKRLIQFPGEYRLSVRMRSRAEPIYFMRYCGSTPEMDRMMNEWIADFHVYSVTFQLQ